MTDRPADLFLSVEIVHHLAGHALAGWQGDAPLLAVWVVVALPDRVIGNDIDDHIRIPIVYQLVIFAWLEQEGIAGFNPSFPTIIPHDAVPFQDVIKFPLRAVRMKGVWNTTGRDSQDFHVEGVSFHQVHRLGISPQCDGNTFA